VDKHIGKARLENSDEIVKLLNKVTLHLKSKGVNQWKHPWNPEEIILDINTENIYLLLFQGLIAGTFAIKKLEEEKFHLMKIGDYYIYRIALLPEFQGNNLGREIIDYACEYAERNFITIYLDCYSGNKKLREFYLKSGLDYVGDFPEEDYFVSVFRYEPYKLSLCS
jgi:GNAT superfamily N-acetyltransferase